MVVPGTLAGADDQFGQDRPSAQRGQGQAGSRSRARTGVITTCTSAPALTSSRTKRAALYAAMLPVTPSSTLRCRDRSTWLEDRSEDLDQASVVGAVCGSDRLRTAEVQLSFRSVSSIAKAAGFGMRS